MSQAGFDRYLNIHEFAEKWRGYKRVSEILTRDKYRSSIQHMSYILIKYVRDQGHPVLIYLFAKNSKYAEQSTELKKLLMSIRVPSDVMLITKNEFKIYSVKAIAVAKHLNVKTFLHENFSIIIPKGPLCQPHRILSAKETNRVLTKELFCDISNLPKIYENDPQCIWIGAEIGDVVEVISDSDISGKYMTYRLVVGSNRKK